MSLLWPGFLLLLALIPVIVAIYIWAMRRQRVGLRYSSLSLVRVALPRYSRIKRHLPFALFLLAITGLIVALARPVNVVAVPSGEATIILALDVSGSMRQNDIEPTRLGAAQAAALQFIKSQKSGTQIGIVAFAGYAQMIQAPTTDQDALQNAVESLTLGRATNIGSGILQSLDAIAEADPNVAPSNESSTSGAEPTPVPQGDYAPDIIVLLTDGVATTGPAPLDTAQEAVDRGVRVYTIGFGTAQGSSNFGPPGGFGGFGLPPGFGQGQGQGQQSGPGSQYGGGGGGFGRGGFRRGIDEETLKQIASMTGAQYYAASSADELLNVFQNLPTSLITKHEVMEITVGFAGFGALLAAIAVFLSLRWHPLP